MEFYFAGHRGVISTLAALREICLAYYLQINKCLHLQCYVCLVAKGCQLNLGFCIPLRIPDILWLDVLMDFIAGLPGTTKRFDLVFGIVNRFFKMGHFSPCKKTTNASHDAKLYFQHSD